jgi:anhydro-N-acetylmuramic acid kinase
MTMSRQMTIEKLARKRKLRVAGLMSGTSADGIDVAIVDMDDRKIETIAFETYAYPASLRKTIFRLFQPDSARLDDICHYNVVLGEAFAHSIIKLCKEAKIPLNSLDLIGSHGQTIYHNPKGRRYSKNLLRSTLQIGEPSVIAQRTGVTTVADFRPRDMAAGGQGAPLVPYADYILFRNKKIIRAVQNIGGIANVTYLPANCRLQDVIAFDTGPGNMVIDELIRRISNGKRKYDREGRFARKGTVNKTLLRQMLSHPFFRQRPPKTTGREEFGRQFSANLCTIALKEKISDEDLAATATALTAESIALSYRNFLPKMPDEMILCGGGSHNNMLVNMLQDRLHETTIRFSDEFGISTDAKEAVSFAVLAYMTIHGRANNVPRATGAGRPVILGKIIPVP